MSTLSKMRISKDFLPYTEIKESIQEFYTLQPEIYDIKLKATGSQNNEMYKRWIKDFSDYSIYENNEYVYESIASFKFYSSRDVRYLYKHFKDNPPKSILDYGCGIGLSTLYFAFLFPKTTIYAYDFSNKEIDFLKYLINKYSIKNIIIVSSPIPAELVCCFEVLEHNKDLDDFIPKVLNNVVKYFAYSSCFKTVYLGHFPEYYFNGKIVPHRKVKRQLNAYFKNKFNYVGQGWKYKPYLFEVR